MSAAVNKECKEEEAGKSAFSTGTKISQCALLSVPLVLPSAVNVWFLQNKWHTLNLYVQEDTHKIRSTLPGVVAVREATILTSAEQKAFQLHALPIYSNLET